MSEQNATPGPVASSAALDDDDVIDVLDAEDEDLDDDGFDLDDEPLALDDNVLVQELVPEDVVQTDGDAIDMGLEDDTADGIGDDTDDGIEDDLLGAADLLAEATTALPASMPEERLARLEETARVLTQTEQAREQGRVRRKVKAATTGAGAAGFIPILLDLIGALDLPPELAATAATGASILGSLLAGYFTPEKAQPVTSTPAAQDLINEGV
jgi:hypothetical protein